MNELGMAVDVSHLNDKSFYKVIELAQKQIATHSNCRFVCDVPRNLSDNQIKLICEKHGIIGLNFYPLFFNYYSLSTLCKIVRSFWEFYLSCVYQTSMNTLPSTQNYRVATIDNTL